MSADTPDGEPKRPGKTGMRLGNRLVLMAFAVSALAFLIVPFVVQWWGISSACPYSVTSRGVSDGTKWEVIRSDCGPGPAPGSGAVERPGGGIIWQLRVIPDRGYSAVVMTAGGRPEPVKWEQSGFTGTVVIAAPAEGETATRFPIKLDPKGQPTEAVEFVDGKRKR
ncbi:MAG: hypothetical protein P4L82_13465 [Ancalomicrobiaceae bacterium]|nr:hypothetical protein [Ancalomicrobiaceae bacterium]